ncbi:riboflavin synthase [Thiotrichales bacterium 19X7-9]|nr:riboflavin synthase [Thiotrichales bacterium 19X7-9]TNF67283.1 MAG: riboflavin synthase [Gammaproteobacteria bacterium]UTW42648.1 riboflavin synthase [bacterium SCSIO 12844]
MFTGLVEDIGQLASFEMYGGDVRLGIKPSVLDFKDIHLGDSIAINGVCLTVVNQNNQTLSFDVSNESLQKTSLSRLRPGDYVNLEQALAFNQRLGGHLVSGHVDGLAELIYIREDARSWRLIYKAPEHLMRYIVEKGSVSLDGISLTVNEVSEQTFSVNIIPHTRNKTVIQYYNVGQKVNLEVDMVARYLERLVSTNKPATNKEEPSNEGVSYIKLIKAGF